MLPRLYMVSGNSVYLNHVQGFLQRKRLVHDWIHLEENVWVQQLLPEPLNSLLEYHHKIPQGNDTTTKLRGIVDFD